MKTIRFSRKVSKDTQPTEVATVRQVLLFHHAPHATIVPCHAVVAAMILTMMLYAASVAAQVPALINYQGRVAVHGTNFQGTGLFKFALVNSNGAVTFWSHDGPSNAGSEPASAVPLTVAGGIFAVHLGDTSVSNMTAVLPPAVFTNSDVCLRLWFNDGVSGSQKLTPDQRLTSVPYAMMAEAASFADMAGTAPANNLTGTLPAAQLPSNVALLDANPTFAGSVSAQTFSGNGAGLSNLALSAIGPPGTFSFQSFGLFQPA